MRWFPNYFHVCQHTYIDFSKIEDQSVLHVIRVEDDKETLNEALGIPYKRAEELGDLVKKAVMVHNNKVSVMEAVSKECKHANEIFMCVELMNKLVAPMMGDGIMGAIIRGAFDRRNGSKGDN